VEQVLEDLQLNHIADSRIGDSDSGGISGGERKRLSIGIELVADTLFMILDEPTSGLDSTNAETVMKVVRSVADRHCACLFTIHQPPASVFDLFDKVLLLNKNGEQVFFGPPNIAIKHFSDFNSNWNQEHCGTSTISEYFVDLLNDGSPSSLSDLSQFFF